MLFGVSGLLLLLLLKGFEGFKGFLVGDPMGAGRTEEGGEWN